MTALATGAHILHLTITDERTMRYRATCSLRCDWAVRNVARKEATRLHAAHLDAVTEAMREGENDAKD